MTTKTAVITGANSGLGLECARSLLAIDESWHVVLAVRDPARGATAIAELAMPQRCSVIPLDLASLASVRSFAERLDAADLPPLRAVVCNAGVQVVDGTKYTADGIEMTFGVNHLGHFALVHSLLDRVEAPARIVIVSSGTHDPAKFTGMPKPHYATAEELAHPSTDVAGDGRLRYTTSKLCNVLFAYELDRRLGQGANGVTVTVFDPGLMPGSGLARDYSAGGRFVWRFVMPVLRVLPNVNSTRTSGGRLAALAGGPAYEGVTGTYFEGAQAIRSSADSYDEVLAKDLWETSARLA